MKKLFILIILIITNNALSMATDVAEVPDKVYFFTKSKKDLVYEFTSDKNISDQIKTYKIKSKVKINNVLITPEELENINQIIIKIGTKDKPRETPYDIDISELTQTNFPKLKTLNVNQAPKVKNLINIPYPCFIKDIVASTNAIRNELIKQLDAADARTITPVALTSKQPIKPQEENKSIPRKQPKEVQPIPVIIFQQQPVTSPIIAPISQTTAPTLSYWQRWQNWIQRNKTRLVIRGTAAVGLTVSAYYLWRNPERLNKIKAWFNWYKK